MLRREDRALACESENWFFPLTNICYVDFDKVISLFWDSVFNLKMRCWVRLVASYAFIFPFFFRTFYLEEIMLSIGRKPNR